MTLSGQGPLMNLYTDRTGGDEDLKGMEDIGVHTFRVNHADPYASLMAKIRLMRDKEIKELGLKSVFVDTWSYFQNQIRSKNSGGNLKGMTLARHKDVDSEMTDAFQALCALPVHLVILCHINEIPVMGGKDGKEVVGKIWQHDMAPKIYKTISREVMLMGYTWKKTGEDGKPIFGTCFTENMGKFTFKDAKAPPGWGNKEPSDIRLWMKRLDAEAEQRRAAARAAFTSNPDYVPAPAEIKNETVDQE